MVSLRRGERLNFDRSEIGRKIAEALGYAHQRGVVHRDIKPANIPLTSARPTESSSQRSPILHCGKLTESEMIDDGRDVRYAPPSCRRNRFTGAQVGWPALTSRWEWFSTGWLRGNNRFRGGVCPQFEYKVVHTEPIPPRKLNPALPAKFESVILKCMEKDPSARYQTGEELARELSELRTSKTVTNTSLATSRVMTAADDPDATLAEAIPTVPAPAVVATTAKPIASAPVPGEPAQQQDRAGRCSGSCCRGGICGLVHLACAAEPASTPAATSPATAPAPQPIVPITRLWMHQSSAHSSLQSSVQASADQQAHRCSVNQA